MPELIYRNRRTGEERIHVEINAAEISDILDDFTPAADAFAATKELHGLLLEALAVFSPTLAETHKAADAPSDPSPTTDGGLREQLVAALVRAGFGEQDADDAVTVVLAVRDRRVEQLLARIDRVIALHETWTAAGPPPLGTSINRWWDLRLVELRQALTEPGQADA